MVVALGTWQILLQHTIVTQETGGIVFNDTAIPIRRRGPHTALRKECPQYRNSQRSTNQSDSGKQCDDQIDGDYHSPSFDRLAFREAGAVNFG
jgi:hypothetical protein